MTTVADTMRRKLTETLAPTRLAIIDESHRHAGHAGARPEGETHFRIEIVSAAFAGLSRIERRRRPRPQPRDADVRGSRAMKWVAVLTSAGRQQQTFGT